VCDVDGDATSTPLQNICVAAGMDAMNRRSSTQAAAILPVVLLAGLGACRMPLPNNGQPQVAATSGEPRALDSDAEPRACESASGQLLLYTDELLVLARTQPNGLILTYREYPLGANTQRPEQAETIDYFFETSVPVQYVAARQSSEIFVLGTDGVLEKWTLEIPNGSRYFTIKGFPGVASGPMPEWETGIQGGVHIPVSQRPRELGRDRTVVWTGNPGAKRGGMVVDPEGRYLLFRTWKPHVVYQLSLSTGAQPIELGSEVNIPDLARCRGGGYLAQHDPLGRLFIFEYSAPGTTSMSRLIFVDANNDGFFESILNLTDSEWVARGMDGPVWYAPNFLELGVK
jgi:hypothetical protein